MTTNRLPEIAKKAERLNVEIEKAVRGFSRYQKYTIGTDLRNQSMAVLRLCNRAWRDQGRRSYWISELIWAIDELKLTMQTSSQLHAFKNFGQFERLIRAADELGRCAGGWKRQAHQKSQNHHVKHEERVQILSGHAAFNYSRANK